MLMIGCVIIFCFFMAVNMLSSFVNDNGDVIKDEWWLGRSHLQIILSRKVNMVANWILVNADMMRMKLLCGLLRTSWRCWDHIGLRSTLNSLSIVASDSVTVLSRIGTTLLKLTVTHATTSCQAAVTQVERVLNTLSMNARRLGDVNSATSSSM